VIKKMGGGGRGGTPLLNVDKEREERE